MSPHGANKGLLFDFDFEGGWGGYEQSVTGKS